MIRSHSRPKLETTASAGRAQLWRDCEVAQRILPASRIQIEDSEQVLLRSGARASPCPPRG